MDVSLVSDSFLSYSASAWHSMNLAWNLKRFKDIMLITAFSALTLLVGHQEGHPDADLHMAQLMPLPLIVSCFSKIQIGFTFLVPAHPGGPRKRAVKRACVCVYVNHWDYKFNIVVNVLLFMQQQNHCFCFF